MASVGSSGEVSGSDRILWIAGFASKKRNGKGELVFGAAPELWSPEHPKLYDVSLQCAGDEVRDKVGFREIKVKGMDIVLNGKPVFLKGISCHEDSVLNGKALTDEERIENIRLAKELGCNFMRVAHYPHSERMAQMPIRDCVARSQTKGQRTARSLYMKNRSKIYEKYLISKA